MNKEGMDVRIQDLRAFDIFLETEKQNKTATPPQPKKQQNNAGISTSILQYRFFSNGQTILCFNKAQMLQITFSSNYHINDLLKTSHIFLCYHNRLQKNQKWIR